MAEAGSLGSWGARWREWQNKNRRLQQQLKSYGMAGLIAYGLCNTLYYTFAFLFIWVYIAKVPRGEQHCTSFRESTLQCTNTAI